MFLIHFLLHFLCRFSGLIVSEVPTEVYQNFDNAGEGDNWWEVCSGFISFLLSFLFSI